MVHVGNRHARLARASDHRGFALLALVAVERRAIHVDTQLSACGTLAGDRAVGHPHVFADAERHRHARHVVKRHVVVAGGEVSRLVEHRIVGQELLVVHADDRAVGADRSGVEQLRWSRARSLDDLVVGYVDESDDHCTATGACRHFLESGAIVGDEASLQDEVFGRVARQRQLGESDEVTPGRLGPRHILLNFRQVVGQIADPRIDLGESDPQRRCWCRVGHVVRLLRGHIDGHSLLSGIRTNFYTPFTKG